MPRGSLFLLPHVCGQKPRSGAFPGLSSDIMVNSIIGVTFLKALNKLKPSLDKLLQNLSSIRRSKPTKKPKTT